MPFWSNLRTCSIYFVYLFIFFWMLIKEFLGYQVDWSRHPFTKSQKVDSHKGFRERNKDLEANLDASANTVFPDGSKKMTSKEKQNGRCDSDYFVIYEAHPVHTKEATSGTDCGLTSQVLPTPPLSHEPGTVTHDRTRDSSHVRSKTPAIVQSSEKDVSHIDLKLEGFIAKDSLHEQRQLEDAATSRLNFIKGLKYKENNSGSWTHPTLICLTLTSLLQISSFQQFSPLFVPSRPSSSANLKRAYYLESPSFQLHVSLPSLKLPPYPQ